FPAEYAVGVLNHHAGMYPTWVHVEDLRRHGVEFRAPCVNASAWDTTLERDAPLERGDVPARADGRDPLGSGRSIPGRPTRAVRIGLGRVAGLAAATGARIVAAREDGPDGPGRPFRGLADLGARVRPTLPELEALILAGALDFTGRTRPSLLLEARVAHGVGARGRPAPAAARELVAPDGAPLAPEAAPPMELPALPEFTPAERVRGECRATGLWFSAHPLEVWVAPTARRGVTPAAALPGRAGCQAAVVGLPCAWRRVETKSGGSMLFLTLADQSGLAECVLFPDAYRALATAVRGAIVRAEGRVDETLDAVTLVVGRAKSLA
ncbi:MAG TPA: OB-fold nucleic acid binding domain-containing protein, partial [Candidatus Eisenbacteria bacterium]